MKISDFYRELCEAHRGLAMIKNREPSEEVKEPLRSKSGSLWSLMDSLCSFGMIIGDVELTEVERLAELRKNKRWAARHHRYHDQIVEIIKDRIAGPHWSAEYIAASSPTRQKKKITSPSSSRSKKTPERLRSGGASSSRQHLRLAKLRPSASLHPVRIGAP